jgi:hypothetical protein
MNYEKREALESIENSDIINASELEKVKLSDEVINKKNLSKVRYNTGINTDSLSGVLFLNDKVQNSEQYNDINSEKYNVPIRSEQVYGSKVFNGVTKDDIMNNPRVSDTTFTI